MKRILDNNQITDIPDGFFAAVSDSLTTLIMSNNQLSRVPFAVSELPALVTL
jgi:Leucine-rich repeat (LRR) protein